MVDPHVKLIPHMRGSIAPRLFNNFPFSTRVFVDFMPYDYYGHNGPIMRAIATFIMGK